MTAMLVDVYHSGAAGFPRAPYLLMPVGAETLPPHPAGKSRQWEYWKQVPINSFVKPAAQARAEIQTMGFCIR